jgi:hypothetical protein
MFEEPVSEQSYLMPGCKQTYHSTNAQNCIELSTVPNLLRHDRNFKAARNTNDLQRKFKLLHRRVKDMMEVDTQTIRKRHLIEQNTYGNILFFD